MVVYSFQTINYEDNPPPPLPLVHTYMALTVDQGGWGVARMTFPSDPACTTPHPAFQHRAASGQKCSGESRGKMRHGIGVGRQPDSRVPLVPWWGRTCFFPLRFASPALLILALRRLVLPAY